MPGSMPPLDQSRQIAEILKRLQRLERATAAPSGFDPNADPVVIGSGANGNGAGGSVVIGESAYNNGLSSVDVGRGATTNGTQQIAIGLFSTCDGASGHPTTNAIAIGHNASVSLDHVQSIALGGNAATTKAHQIMLGTSSDFVEIPGNGTANGLVLTDTATGTRYLIQITSGALVLSTAP